MLNTSGYRRWFNQVTYLVEALLVRDLGWDERRAAARMLSAAIRDGSFNGSIKCVASLSVEVWKGIWETEMETVEGLHGFQFGNLRVNMLMAKSDSGDQYEVRYRAIWGAEYVDYGAEFRTVGLGRSYPDNKINWASVDVGEGIRELIALTLRHPDTQYFDLVETLFNWVGITRDIWLLIARELVKVYEEYGPDSERGAKAEQIILSNNERG